MPSFSITYKQERESGNTWNSFDEFLLDGDILYRCYLSFDNLRKRET